VVMFGSGAMIGMAPIRVGHRLIQKGPVRLAATGCFAVGAGTTTTTTSSRVSATTTIATTRSFVTTTSGFGLFLARESLNDL